MELIKARKLYRPKASGWVAHNGLELTFSNSSSIIFHNGPQTGPTLCSYSEFAEQQQVVENEELTTNLEGVWDRVQQMVSAKRNYHPTVFNCEQAVNLALFCKSVSPQVKATTSGALVFGGICLFLGGNWKQTMAAVAAGGALGLSTSKSNLLSTPTVLNQRVL